jgi:hypothetical protein
MKRILRRRPSPALVIALIALFVAMGGVSYGLATGSIDSREIRNRTITDSDVKRRSLEGTLIKKDRIGYNAVKEEGLDASKLKKVKSAEEADKVGGATVRRVAALDLNVGQSSNVASVGPFTLTARCRADAADHVAEIVVQTNQNDSAVDGAQPDADFDVGEVAALVVAQGVGGTPVFDQEAAGAAIAPDGTELMGQELYAGASVLGHPNRCRFGGLLFTSG